MCEQGSGQALRRRPAEGGRAAGIALPARKPTQRDVRPVLAPRRVPGLQSEETGCVCGCPITQQLRAEVSSGNRDPGQVAKAHFKPEEEAESVTSILLTCPPGCRPSAHFPTQPRDRGTDQRCSRCRNKPLSSLKGLAARTHGEACRGF